MALPRIDLSAVSIPELRELAGKIQAEITLRVDEEKAALRSEFENRAKASGFTLSEILPATAEKKGKSAAKGKGGGTVPPKYRNPSNPAETWTGRGRSPAWVKACLEEGKTMDALLIDKEAP